MGTARGTAFRGSASWEAMVPEGRTRGPSARSVDTLRQRVTSALTRSKLDKRSGVFDRARHADLDRLAGARPRPRGRIVGAVLLSGRQPQLRPPGARLLPARYHDGRRREGPADALQDRRPGAAPELLQPGVRRAAHQVHALDGQRPRP